MIVEKNSLEKNEIQGFVCMDDRADYTPGSEIRIKHEIYMTQFVKETITTLEGLAEFFKTSDVNDTDIESFHEMKALIERGGRIHILEPSETNSEEKYLFKFLKEHSASNSKAV
jgi:hypothetical protein